MAGIMSGTSLDGIDVCIAKIRGGASSSEIEVLAFESTNYNADLAAFIKSQSEKASSDVASISTLNVLLAHEYAACVESLAKKHGLEIDLVGCHGQTIHHLPDSVSLFGHEIRSTLQLGDHSTLANLLGVPVVGNFRMADMAVGGQGAPLVNYLDYVYFSDSEKGRLVLNMGGIANLTILKAGGRLEEVIAFDTGPANMPVDLLVSKFFDSPFDEDGALAKSGAEINGYVDRWLEDEYIQRIPPKSTGREEYGDLFIDRISNDLAFSKRSAEDQIRTVSEFVARSIATNIRKNVTPISDFDVLLAAGGGVHNGFIMGRLQELLPELEVASTERLSLNPDAREALCFALFAHEFLNGVPSNCVTATGATRPAILGSLAIP